MRVDLGEDVRERGGGEHRETRKLRSLRAAGEGDGESEGQHRRKRAHPHVSTITDVDLTTAVADIPGFSPSSSIASRVTTATIRVGSVTVSST